MLGTSLAYTRLLKQKKKPLSCGFHHQTNLQFSLLWTAPEHVKLFPLKNHFGCFHVNMKSFDKVERLRAKSTPLKNANHLISWLRPSFLNKMKKSLSWSFHPQTNEHPLGGGNAQPPDFSTKNLWKEPLLSCFYFENFEKVEQNLSVDKHLLQFPQWCWICQRPTRRQNTVFCRIWSALSPQRQKKKQRACAAWPEEKLSSKIATISSKVTNDKKKLSIPSKC